MLPRALVPIADGSEELETVTIVNVLRRAGVEVTVAGVGAKQVRCSRGVQIVADCLIQECRGQDWDAIVLPGGMPGAEHLRDSTELVELLRAHVAAGKLYAAICASPAVVLHHHGLLRGRRATCYPGFEQGMTGYQPAPVVVDGSCITANGPGSALRFALTVAAALVGREKAAAVARAMLADDLAA
ncbi:MAG: DJ-1/PfpI family protein [bacterium]|nr:DJ-1/PfpI family protein [bacterium]